MMPVTDGDIQVPSLKEPPFCSDMVSEVFMKLTLLIQILYSSSLKLCWSALFLRAGLPAGWLHTRAALQDYVWLRSGGVHA
jgi:hypothetical protein